MNEMNTTIPVPECVMLLKVDGKVKKVKKVVSKLTFNRSRRRRCNFEYGDAIIGGPYL